MSVYNVETKQAKVAGVSIDSRMVYMVGECPDAGSRLYLYNSSTVEVVESYADVCDMLSSAVRGY